MQRGSPSGDDTQRPGSDLLMPSAATPSKIVFIVTEDWFFASHFLPMARAARELGMDVTVVTRIRRDAAAIEATGAVLIPLEAERRSLNPLKAMGVARRLAAILRTERPDIVHCIALKPILLGGLAARLAGINRRVYALTGLGLIGAKEDAIGRAARAGVRAVIRGPLASKATRYLFENSDDPLLLGLEPDAAEVTLVGGAGVDPAVYPELPQPAFPPLRVALVARMLWSKGIDLAVEAVQLARQRGADVRLSLYGAPDPSNPKAVPLATLARWSEMEGIDWHGHAEYVVPIWRTHHVACLPSRGGEGLPRTLLEAAACGRAMVTTDVPGCRSFVRDGEDGIVVPPDDASALADAFVQLAGAPETVAAMGGSARARVLAGHTERQVMDTVKRLYGELLDLPR